MIIAKRGHTEHIDYILERLQIYLHEPISQSMIALANRIESRIGSMTDKFLLQKYSSYLSDAISLGQYDKTKTFIEVDGIYYSASIPELLESINNKFILGEYNCGDEALMKQHISGIIDKHLNEFAHRIYYVNKTAYEYEYEAWYTIYADDYETIAEFMIRDKLNLPMHEFVGTINGDILFDNIQSKLLVLFNRKIDDKHVVVNDMHESVSSCESENKNVYPDGVMTFSDWRKLRYDNPDYHIYDEIDEDKDPDYWMPYDTLVTENYIFAHRFPKQIDLTKYM